MSCPLVRTGMRFQTSGSDNVTVADAMEFVQTCFRAQNDNNDARILTADTVAKAMGAVKRLDQIVEQVKQENLAETIRLLPSTHSTRIVRRDSTLYTTTLVKAID